MKSKTDEDAKTAGSPSAERSAPAATCVTARRYGVVVDAVENLTHDLNNALMSLGNYAELCAMPATPQAKRDTYGRKVADLVDEAATAIRRLRNIATLDARAAAPTSVESLLDPVLAASRTGLRHAGLRLEFDPTSAAQTTSVQAAPDDAVHALLDAIDLGKTLALASGAARGATLELLLAEGTPSAAGARRVALRLCLGLPLRAPADLLEERLAALRELATHAGAELASGERADGSWELELLFVRAGAAV